MELVQKIEQQLSGQQLINLRLLQMNVMDLTAYIEEQARSNPVIDVLYEQAELERINRAAVDGQPGSWDNDVYERYTAISSDDGYDPLRTIGDAGGLEETLSNSLCLQIDCFRIPEPLASRMKYLAFCLDDSGYLRIGLSELSKEQGCTEGELEEALKKLQEISPPGIAARSLSECLGLQLRRQGADTVTVAAAEGFLEELAARKYQDVAAELGISVDEVREIKKKIAGLNARPGLVFASSAPTVYVVPEIFVEKQGDEFVLNVNEKKRHFFSLNDYYCKLLKTTEDEEVRTYLKEKIRQARFLRWGIEQRESTLRRCAAYIFERQKAFFSEGSSALVPLSLADAANALDLNISTVSRTVQNKYLSYPGGIVPLSYFFVRKANTSQPDSLAAANLAVCERIRKMIADENKHHPLSDQAICDRLRSEGIRISRRTVAKYRSKMKIPAAAER